MGTSNPSSNRRRNILCLAGSLTLIAVVCGYYGIPVISESLALKYYESRVDPILQRGMAIKNYLRTLEASLRAGSGNALTEMTPERLKSFPACTEQLTPHPDLPNVEVFKWQAPTTGGRSDPWKNLAAHWARGTHVERSAVKMLHLNMDNDGTCEPDIRILIEGTDSNGKYRQDTFYARLRVNF